MKFAVWLSADQTIVYLMADGISDTTRHPEAKLWDTRKEAEAMLGEYNDALVAQHRARVFGEVEEVADEAEFRARKDTW